MSLAIRIHSSAKLPAVMARWYAAAGVTYELGADTIQHIEVTIADLRMEEG